MFIFLLVVLNSSIVAAQSLQPDVNREELRTVLNQRDLLEAAKRLERLDIQRLQIVKSLGFKDGPMCIAPMAISTDDVDPHRSLFVHDLETLGPKDFGLERILTQIATQASSKVPGTTAASIFRQFWDTQNDTATAVDASNIHCDDNDSKLNGFPHNTCPRPEGKEAIGNDLELKNRMKEYKPTALVNRLDLAHSGWRNCGEHRIIYAKEGNGIEKNLIIFEAVLPNPKPGCRSGCRDVIEFWLDLSQDPSSESRAQKLETFFYNGIPGFNPVIHIDHYNAAGASSIYGGSGSGQIRTNQFLQNGALSPWTLKEFKTLISCRSGSCDFDIVPISVKVNPYGELWNKDIATGAKPPARPINNITSLATDLQSDAIAQVTLDKLADPDLNSFSYSVDLNKNAAESQSLSPVIDHYPNQFTSAADGTFRTALNTAASSFGLTGQQIVNRATAQSCAGCHMPSAFGLLNPNSIGPGQNWPDALSFVHVGSHSQSLPPNQLPSTATSPQGFPLSPALLSQFLPTRENHLVDLANQEVCDCVLTRSAFPFTPKRQLDLTRILNASNIRLGDGLTKLKDALAQEGPITRQRLSSHLREQRTLILKEEATREQAIRKAGIPLPQPATDVVTVDLNLTAAPLSKKELKQLKVRTANELVEKEPMRQTVTGSFRVH